ncbi:MAG: hypothetical protein JXB47_21210 [Anaerolineae bacterium]|nr:hypothetical protein [Anaerolineae bacterium]
MPTPHEAFNTLVYQTLEAAAALLEAGRPAEALHTIKHLGEMEITARQREQYGALRREIEAQLVTDSWVALQLAHPEPLTFALFTEGVVPYLQALHRLHEVVARLQGKSPAWDPEIRQMSHHSPFSITFGFWHPDIIRTILEVIFDERRGPARRIKAGEPRKQRELTRVDATYRLLEKVVPDATPEQKAALAHQLLPDIDLLASSPVEGQVIGVSVSPEDRALAPAPPPSRPEPAPEPAPSKSKAEPAAPELPAPADSAVDSAADVSTGADDGPRYIGQPAPGVSEPKPAPLYQPPRPRRRVTRPAPKPFSPPEHDENEEDGENEYGENR